MRQFFVTGDDNVRAITETDDGILIAFPPADGGKIDGTNPRVLSGFEELSDNAGIVERSHLPDPTLERFASQFTQTI